jgi:hypothetical protein
VTALTKQQRRKKKVSLRRKARLTRENLEAQRRASERESYFRQQLKKAEPEPDAPIKDWKVIGYCIVRGFFASLIYDVANKKWRKRWNNGYLFPTVASAMDAWEDVSTFKNTADIKEVIDKGKHLLGFMRVGSLDGMQGKNRRKHDV